MNEKTSLAKKPSNYQEIIKTIKNKQFEKIYFLHGEEPFFIDQITNAIIDNAIDASARDFNQSIYYGIDCDPKYIITEAQSYPMLGDRRLIIIKEAQEFKSRKQEEDIDALEPYFSHPMDSTILVIAYKHKTYDARKKLLKLSKANGIVFLSEKVRDYKLTDWITQYVKQNGYQMTPKAAVLVGEALGTDLSRIVGELEKISIIVPKGTLINEQHIEDNIGISREYNFFEMSNAFAEVDFLKACKIINYFEKNPKVGQLPPIISTLYNYHVQLLKIAFSGKKTDKQIADELHINPYNIGRYKQVVQRYSKQKIAKNIEILLEYELKAKGIENATSSPSDLMKEMMFRLIY